MSKLVMTFETTLAEAGFDGEAAKKLADNERFIRNYANKFSEEILERINLIAAIYDTDADSVRDAITKFPPFAGLDHKRVMRKLSRIGRIVGLDEGTVKEKIMNTLGKISTTQKKVLKRYLKG